MTTVQQPLSVSDGISHPLGQHPSELEHHHFDPEYTQSVDAEQLDRLVSRKIAGFHLPAQFSAIEGGLSTTEICHIWHAFEPSKAAVGQGRHVQGGYFTHNALPLDYGSARVTSFWGLKKISKIGGQTSEYYAIVMGNQKARMIYYVSQENTAGPVSDSEMVPSEHPLKEVYCAVCRQAVANERDPLIEHSERHMGQIEEYQGIDPSFHQKYRFKCSIKVDGWTSRSEPCGRHFQTAETLEYHQQSFPDHNPYHTPEDSQLDAFSKKDHRPESTRIASTVSMAQIGSSNIPTTFTKFDSSRNAPPFPFQHPNQGTMFTDARSRNPGSLPPRPYIDNNQDRRTSALTTSIYLPRAEITMTWTWSYIVVSYNRGQQQDAGQADSELVKFLLADRAARIWLSFYWKDPNKRHQVVCDVCQEILPRNEADIGLHAARHLGTAPTNNHRGKILASTFRCQDCGRLFGSEVDLHDHTARFPDHTKYTSTFDPLRKLATMSPSSSFIEEDEKARGTLSIIPPVVSSGLPISIVQEAPSGSHS